MEVGYVCKWKRGELGEIMKGDGIMGMSMEQRRVTCRWKNEGRWRLGYEKGTEVSLVESEVRWSLGYVDGTEESYIGGTVKEGGS